MTDTPSQRNAVLIVLGLLTLSAVLAVALRSWAAFVMELWWVACLVLAILDDYRRRKQARECAERDFLERWAQIAGVQVIAAESNAELRMRIVRVFKGEERNREPPWWQKGGAA